MKEINQFLKLLESVNPQVPYPKWDSVVIDVQNATYEINFLEPIIDDGRIVTGVKVWWTK